MKTMVVEIAETISATILAEYAQGKKPLTPEEEARATALDLLKCAGIVLNDSRSPRERGVHWDGAVLSTRGQNASALLHELAHFQCADPKRWCVPEFGMTPGPAVVYAEAVQAFPGLFQNRPIFDELLEELRANLLGILWERSVGVDFCHTLVEDNWIDPNDKVWDCLDYDEILVWLIEQGLIDNDGNPILVFRNGSTKVTASKVPD